MKTDEHEKSMTADPEEVEGKPDIVKDMTSGYVDPPAASSRMNAGNPTPPASPPPAMVKSGFMSVSLSKAHGSPCPSKPKYVDSGPEWEEGKSSKEEPVEEDGQYLPPSMKMVKEDGEDKVVKKSFVSAQLSKAVGASPPKSAAPKAGYEWGNKPPQTKTQNLTYLPDDRWDTGYEEKIASPQAVKKSFVSAQRSKAVGTTSPKSAPAPKTQLVTSKQKPMSPSDAPIGTRSAGHGGASYLHAGKGRHIKVGDPKDPQGAKEGQEVYAGTKGVSVKKLTPTVREVMSGAFATPQAVKKSLTELRYGSQLARNHDIGKSCGMCGRISKSCGDHDGGCCGDCKKSMSSVNWHDSHLA
tara:strand:+ start:543 stop:1607 length:1065 start_codon:yes stop_codon:yes gene_type:complete